MSRSTASGVPEPRAGGRASRLHLGSGCGVGVRSASAGALDGLRESFGAWEQPAAGPEWEVECVLDATRCEALARQVAGEPGVPSDVFALDSSTVRLPTWRREDATLAFDDFCGCWYVLAPRRLTLVAPRGAARAALGLLRLVREAVCARTAAGTLLDLHAAALEHDGRAVVLCGPRRAGKSSLLCHLLRGGAAALLGNDRTQLRDDGAGLVARGIPTIVRLRAAAPGLDRGPPLAGADGARRLTLAQLCAELGVVARLQAPVGVLVHLQLAPGGPPWELSPAGREEGEALLRRALYGPPRARPTLVEELLGTAPPEVARVEARIAEIAARMPQLLCRLGPGAYGQPAAPLLAALRAAWTAP